jgi:hypothetical protein
MLTGDNRYLLKVPIHVGKDRLNRAMSKICAEYSALVGDKTYRYLAKLRRIILSYHLKIARIETLFMLAKHRDVRKELKKVCGTDDTNGAIIALKNLKIQLQVKLSELAKYTVVEKLDKGDAYLMLEASLARHFGFHIDDKKITVAQIAAYQNNLRKEIANERQLRSRRAYR